MKSNDKQIDFLLHELGQQIHLNNLPAKGVLTAAPQSGDYYFDDKLLRVKTAIATGNVVTVQGENWLVISQVVNGKNSRQCKIRKSNHLTKFTLEDWLYEFVSITDMNSLTLGSGGAVTIEKGRLQVTLPCNPLSEQIYVNQRFIASHTAWVVVGIDFTKTGLVLLEAQKSNPMSDDDFVNEIANKNSIPLWTLSVLEATREIKIGGSLQYTPQLKKDNVLQAVGEFAWQSSDTKVATVVDGLVAGIANGTATITLFWKKHPSILYAFDAVVKEVPVEIPTYKLVMSDLNGSNPVENYFEIFVGTPQKFTAIKYVNGVVVPNDTYTFAFNPNGTAAAKYLYEVLGTDSAKVQSKGFASTMPILTATSNQSGTVLTAEIMLHNEY